MLKYHGMHPSWLLHIIMHGQHAAVCTTCCLFTAALLLAIQGCCRHTQRIISPRQVVDVMCTVVSVLCADLTKNCAAIAEEAVQRFDLSC